MRPHVLPPILIALSLLLGACAEEERPASSSSASTPSVSSPSASPSPVSASPLPTTLPSPTGRVGPEVTAFLALCSVAADVATEDLATAEATFHDEVHDALHELAEDLEGADRQLSAALLQAKSKVEADLAESPPDAGALAADLAELVGAAEDGLEALGIASPGCPEQPQ